MSSNINTVAANIDATFPVAGQDNSSQGFRDNFSAIKLAFSTATTEISNLQLNSAQVNRSNDFQFNGSLLRAKIQNSGFVANNNATTSGELDYSQANYNKVTTTTATSTTTFYVTNWPTTGIYAQVRLEVVAPSTGPQDINFSAPNSGVIRTTASFPYTINTSTTTVWDLWSTDAGANVFVNLVGGPY